MQRDSGTELPKWLRHVSHAVLVANSVFILGLLLAQDSVWNWSPEHRSWLLEFASLFGLVLAVYAYCLYAAIRRGWLHGLFLYGFVTALFAGQSHWQRHPIYYVLPVMSFLSIEILAFVLLYSSRRKDWHDWFAGTHVVMGPMLLAIGVYWTVLLHGSPGQDDKLWWMVLSLLAFYFLNSLNLLLARLLRRRRKLWAYCCGLAESAIFGLLSFAAAVLGGIG